MYALKRTFAYLIDVVILITPARLGVGLLDAKGLIPTLIPEETGPFHSMIDWAISGVVPVLILGTLTGLTGRTPGKLIFGLKVRDHDGEPPGLAQGYLREIVKLVSLGFIFGTFYAVRGLVTTRQTFYDEWLHLDVEDLRPSGLTPTQANFRKYQRELAKKQRRGG